MFLYLSKLLPLLFYPLGLTCVLLVVALVTLTKWPRVATGAIATALVVLLVASNGWVSTALVRSLEWRSRPESLPQADAIVVLGGSTRPLMPPRASVEVSEAGDRVLYGAQLYREGKAPRLILSGGRIDWLGGGPPESADMAAMVQTMGVPESAILEDPDSYNTYQNAINVLQLMRANNIQKILLVTSAMHMPRSLRIFQKLGVDAAPAPTDFLVTQQELEEYTGSLQAILLNLTPDSERLLQTTRALKEYIGLVIYRLRGWL
ncbi:YdcF family protein [Geitlerinema sp. PCC 7407]|uniref:YdcF family protein n=1 Tax=Geitlerinema sp. PCC 7407 TaxID=1173025 RepID=UPI00029F8BA8|nr:YdcF family protein [Geitlerinema sp. PCC 7407]AFY64738.1 protein of unknown function DUF218 [Geitlerinema sp. PCC 7407]